MEDTKRQKPEIEGELKDMRGKWEEKDTRKTSWCKACHGTGTVAIACK